MKSEFEQLSAQESLAIITNMIHEAKGNVQKNAFHFLLWGWVVAIADLGMYVLTRMDYTRPYLVWMITIPAWFISFYVGFRQRRAGRTTTHLDTITGWLWVSFGVCMFTLIAFGSKINYQLNPLIITVSAIPTFVSGTIIRFKPLIFGGLVIWVAGVVCFLVPGDVQPLVGAASVFCGYLIPGYLLRKRKDV